MTAYVTVTLLTFSLVVAVAAECWVVGVVQWANVSSRQQTPALTNQDQPHHTGTATDCHTRPAGACPTLQHLASNRTFMDGTFFLFTPLFIVKIAGNLRTKH